MDLNVFFSSRTRGIPVIIVVVIAACIGIGAVTRKPFDMTWLLALLPYAGFIMGEFNKKKNITISEVFSAQKFREKRWLTGVFIAALPVINWIYFVITNNQLNVPPEYIGIFAGLIALVIGANQGGDLSKIVTEVGDIGQEVKSLERKRKVKKK